MDHFLRRSSLTLIALACLTAASGCSQPEVSSKPDQAFVGRATGLADEHQASLQKALIESMSQVGPVGSIGVCQSTAPAIDAELSTTSGMQVSRIARRNRNPANAVPDELAELYQELEREPLDNGKPRFVTATIADKHVYLRAIPMKEQPCAACHGNDIAPEVSSAITAAYPQDKATGFQAGELRGAFFVSKPAK
ncbi:MAG: DUF3365 domain-containing protein [Porphyrobacter sp.]|nr:DUF3365 domain-containing protein [Porphyrobacter sp.]